MHYAEDEVTNYAKPVRCTRRTRATFHPFNEFDPVSVAVAIRSALAQDESRGARGVILYKKPLATSSFWDAPEAAMVVGYVGVAREKKRALNGAPPPLLPPER